MKIDKLFSSNFNRNAGLNYSYNYSRNAVNALLVHCTAELVHGDRITAKLRHRDGVELVVDRCHMTDLSAICDLNYGYSAHGSFYQQYTRLIGRMAMHPEGGEATNTVEVLQAPNLNGFLINLGNISLEEAELEINVEMKNTGNTLAGVLNVYSVQLVNQPDRLFVYDTTFDMESTHKYVRDLYLVSRSGGSFLTQDIEGLPRVAEPVDLQIQLDVNGETFLSDGVGLVLSTGIFSQVEAPSYAVLRAFSQKDLLPAEIRMKITGDHAGNTSAIFVKEKLVPALTRTSIINNIERQAKAIEKIERENPEAAVAYQATGVPSALELKTAVENAKAVANV